MLSRTVVCPDRFEFIFEHTAVDTFIPDLRPWDPVLRVYALQVVSKTINALKELWAGLPAPRVCVTKGAFQHHPLGLVFE